MTPGLSWMKGSRSEERARARERERGREDGIDERTLNLMGLPREINEEIVMIRREGLKET